MQQWRKSCKLDLKPEGFICNLPPFLFSGIAWIVVLYQLGATQV